MVTFIFMVKLVKLLRSLTWRHQTPPKIWRPFTSRHGVIFHNTAVKT